MLTDVGTCSNATVALNADIEALTAAKESLASVPLEVVFESVVGILGLVRVWVAVCSVSRTNLDDAPRTSSYTTMHW